jgi:hypothetical protein
LLLLVIVAVVAVVVAVALLRDSADECTFLCVA